jgi:hypothetical protein
LHFDKLLNRWNLILYICILCCGIVGTGELGPADKLGSEVSGTHIGKILCHYIFVGCVVAHVSRLCRPAFRMIVPFISDLQVVIFFNFEHRTSVINHKQLTTRSVVKVLFNAKCKWFKKNHNIFLVSYMAWTKIQTSYI